MIFGFLQFFAFFRNFYSKNLLFVKKLGAKIQNSLVFGLQCSHFVLIRGNSVRKTKK